MADTTVQNMDPWEKSRFKIRSEGELPGGPVVRTQHFHCRGPGSIPGRRTKILQATQRSTE